MSASGYRLAILPLAAILLICFVGPFGFVVAQSGAAAAGPLSQYARIFGSSYYLLVIFQTLSFGAVVTVFCVLLGYPLGYAIARAQGWARPLLVFIVLVPLLVNVVVRSFGWMVILGGGGLLDTTMRAIGLGAPGLMYSWTGLTIAMVHVLLPFMALAVAGSVETIDPALPEAASLLGAAPLRGFVHVTLPLSREGIVSGAILTFSLTIGSFVTVMLLGNTGTMVLPLLVYQQLTAASDWPFAAALGVVLLAAVSLLLWLQQALFRRPPGRAV